MFQFLAYTPWWLIFILLLAGAILLFYGNRRGAKRLREAGLMVFALGILLGAAFFLIDTDPERMERYTKQIVADVDAHDWPRLQGMLDPQTQLDFGGQAPSGLANVRGADQIMQLTQKEATQVDLRRVVITGTRTEQSDDLIVVAFNAASWQAASLDRPVVSSWQFNWRLRGGKWFLDTIKLINLASD
jgi:hypothetical protein